MCGNIRVTTFYGFDPASEIGESDQPLAFGSGTFVIDTDDDSLIGQIVPYKQRAVFELYEPVAGTGTSGATFAETSSVIRYLDPCPVIGSTGFDWTTFVANAGPNTLTTDDYSGEEFSIDVDTLFDVSPDFCDSTVVYECTSVTRPNGEGGTITYADLTFPKSLCTLDADNVLKVSADETQYTSVDD